ncbi:MAG: response regulator [Desulfobulbaceae bacterium]|nr:response regulator [Desulfobulbaceae bacterium]
MAQPHNDIYLDFVDEVQSYIPIIQNGIGELRVHPDNRPVLDEIHRLVHSIRGAAGMLGITGLAQLAGSLEEALEHVQTGGMTLDDAMFNAMNRTTDVVEQYCHAIQAAESLDNADLTAASEQICAQISGIPVVPCQKKEPDFALAATAGFELDEELLDQMETIVRNPDAYDAALVEEALAFLQEHIDALPVRRPELVQEENESIPESASMSVSLFSEEEQQMLREGFMEEADEHLQELSRSLQNLESRVEQPASIDEHHRQEVGTIRRAVHTIKGAAAVVGMNDISSYAHQVEDFLDWLFEKAQVIKVETIAVLAASLDLLSTVIEAPNSVDEARKQEIYARLQILIQEAGPAADSEPEAVEVAEQMLHEDAILDAADLLMAESDPLLSPDFNGEVAVIDGLLAELAAEPEPADRELTVICQNFTEEAELQLENIHQSMEFLAGSVSHKVSLADEAAHEAARMSTLVLQLRKGALALGNDGVSTYAHTIAEFLQWLYEEAVFVSPALINVLADAIDVLDQLVHNPDMVDREQVEGIYASLASAKLAASQTEAGAAAEGPALIEQGEELTSVDQTDTALVAAPAADGSAGAPVDAIAIDTSVDKELSQSVAAAEQKGAVAERTSDPATVQPIAADATKTIRIHQNQLDSLINLANDLLVGVSGFDQNMGLFNAALEELDLTVRKLKDIALELETKFEVKALDQLSYHLERIDQARHGIQLSTGFAEFDSMELDRYTQLNLIIRTLNESTIDVAAIHTNLESVYSGIGGDINRQYRVVREMQAQMMRARLSPMSLLTPRLSRTMRDVAAKLKKRVRLVMEGDTVELDRVIWEKLADPFMHLVRNSVHHGIESPEARAATNKPAIATIRIAGRREGNHVVVHYSDDGRGLNFESIRNRARQDLGAGVELLDEQQLTELIFTPGFSTQREITQISGRGVGMDVVRQSVQDLQGSITVASQQGEGTSFTIRVPLTLGVVRALLVDLHGVTYGVALSDIQDIHRIGRTDIAEDRQTFNHGGDALPLYSLPLLLGREESEEEKADPQPLLFMTKVEGGEVGVLLPRIAGQKEVVFKGLGSHLRTVIGVAGAAVMGDGSVIPLLNMAELIGAYLQQYQPETRLEEPVRPKSLTIMIVDDSISIRRVMSRLVTNHGWIAVEAKDGQDALERLDTTQPDCILLDIEMPRMNGFEFLALKGNLAEYKDIPVIMLTSRSSDKHRNKAMELGASAFLNKPTRDEEFVDAVLRLTGHRRTGLNERQREMNL